MTAFYGSFDRDAQEGESLKTIAKALELGINLLDTAWIYQVGVNQQHSTTNCSPPFSPVLYPYIVGSL
jgi:aryl-alcohol dehydrogenase-like predicted oxidoreductase